MNTGIVILIIILILIVLGLIGVAIWYFGFYRKKNDTNKDDKNGKNVNFTFTQTGLTVNFLAEPGLTNWSWNFGDNSPASKLENPTYTYKQSGNYTVTLTATTSSGTSNSSTQTVQVNSGGSTGGTNFTYTISGLVVQFTDTSNNNPTAWSWDFGDGTPLSTLESPTHTYSNDGTYNVKLTVTISSGTDSVTQLVNTGGPPINPPAVASILTTTRTYNQNGIIQFSTPQGSDDFPIGGVNGGIWSTDSAGSYMIFADATNDGGGGSIQLLKNGNSILGTQTITIDGQSTLLTMGYADLDDSNTIEAKVINPGGISIRNPDPLINATSHLIIQKLTPNTSITYLTTGGVSNANAAINFSTPQTGNDTIGSMSNGIWTPKDSGIYLVFADATNDGGGGCISIVKGSGSTVESTVGTGCKSLGAGAGFSTTISTRGLVSLNTGESISVIDLNGINISNPAPLPNATSHFSIQKVDPAKIVSYIFDTTQPNISRNDTLQFSQLQGVKTDSVGKMENGTWTCTTKGKYLIFTDVTNDGGGGSIQLTAAGITIGTGYATGYQGPATILTMGYAELNVNDNVLVTTLSGINITTPDPSTKATGHLIIYKID